MKESKFWKDQPVAIGEEENGTILKPKTLDTEPVELLEGYCWKETSNIEEIHKFLNENYGERDDWILSYTKESLTKVLLNKNHRPEYSIGIFSSDKMVGYIYGREHSITYNEATEIVLGVNFLCLAKNLRGQYISPLLIQELKRRSFNNNLIKAIFVGGGNKGFRFTEATYYHLPLNIPKLKKNIFLPSNINETTYFMRGDTITEVTVEDLLQVHEIYKENSKKFEVYENFTKEQFLFTVMPCENSNYIVYNPNTKEFASFFVIDKVNSKSGTIIRAAYLYYWAGSEQILTDTFAYAQKLGLDIFDILNLGENETHIIEKFNLLEGTATNQTSRLLVRKYKGGLLFFIHYFPKKIHFPFIVAIIQVL